MALDFQVSGPCTIDIGPEGGGSQGILGYASDDSLPTFEIQRFWRELRATDTGDEVAEAVFRGVVGLVTAQLTKWDTAQYTELLLPPGGTTVGGAGIIGSRLVTGGYSFQVDITPRTAGKTKYTFPRCYLADNPVVFDSLGNDGTVLGVAFVVLRDADDSTLADGSSATANLFTTSPTV